MLYIYCLWLPLLLLLLLRLLLLLLLILLRLLSARRTYTGVPVFLLGLCGHPSWLVLVGFPLFPVPSSPFLCCGLSLRRVEYFAAIGGGCLYPYCLAFCYACESLPLVAFRIMSYAYILHFGILPAYRLPVRLPYFPWGFPF